jgi:hypothetical protein
MEEIGQLHALATLPQGKEPIVTTVLRGWMGPRASLNTVKLSLCFFKLSTMPWMHIGGVEVWLYAFLTSALDGSEWSASCPSHFTRRDRATGTHWIGGWISPRAGLDIVVKRQIPTPCWDSNPPIIQSLVQHYTIELTCLLVWMWWWREKFPDPSRNWTLVSILIYA